MHSSVHEVVDHDLGAEAADLTDKAVETAENVTQVGKSVVVRAFFLAFRAEINS